MLSRLYAMCTSPWAYWQLATADCQAPRWHAHRRARTFFIACTLRISSCRLSRSSCMASGRNSLGPEALEAAPVEAAPRSAAACNMCMKHGWVVYS